MYIPEHDVFRTLDNGATNNTGDKSIAQLIEEAGAGYGVHKGQAWCQVGQNPDGSPILVQAPNTTLLYRDSDMAVVSPNSVTKGYGVLNVNYMGEIMQDFVSEGWVTPEACFTVADGYGRASREFVVGRITDPDLLNIPGDRHGGAARYLILGNPQGHGSIFFLPLTFRPICVNQLRGLGSTIKMSHKRNVAERFREASAKFMAVKKEMVAHNALMGVLNQTQFHVPQAVDAVLGIKPGDVDTSKQKLNRRERLLSNAHNASIGCYGDTLGDVYQAVTHDTTHFEGAGGKTATKRFISLTEGTRGRFETDSLNTLLGLAGIDKPKAWVRENVTV